MAALGAPQSMVARLGMPGPCAALPPCRRATCWFERSGIQNSGRPLSPYMNHFAGSWRHVHNDRVELIRAQSCAPTRISGPLSGVITCWRGHCTLRDRQQQVLGALEHTTCCAARQQQGSSSNHVSAQGGRHGAWRQPADAFCCACSGLNAKPRL